MGISNNYFQEETDATLSKKKEQVIERSLRKEQIEGFTSYTLPVEEQVGESITFIEEKKEKKENRKFLVDKYFSVRSYDLKRATYNSFRSLNKWEGIVETIHDDSFTAILRDLNNGGALETVELSFEDVSEQDKPLLKPGAIFYWNIGYETVQGQVRKASIIRFKRLPNWNKKDWDSILDKANNLEREIEWQ